MSNYGSVPPPGPYVPPTQGTPAPGQQPQQQQQQGYGQPNAAGQAQTGHGHKSGGLGKYMDQAVTTGKPMFDKLSKTISSKLSGKPAAGGPPQHLQSYQNYQQHNQPQGYQPQQSQPPGQTYSPQGLQRPWQPPQGPPPPAQAQTPNQYNTPQQSPFPQASNYGTPVSAHSGQSNYFPNQHAQPPNPPPPTASPHNAPPPPNAPGPDMTSSQVQQEQYVQQGQHQGQFQQNQQWQTGQPDGQQTGVVATQNPGYTQNVQAPYQAPHMGDVSPEIPPNKPVAQPAWKHPSQPPGPPPNEYIHPMPLQQPYQNSIIPQQPPQSPVGHQQAFQMPIASHQAVSSSSVDRPASYMWAGTSTMPAPHTVSPPPQQMYAQPQAPPPAASQISQPSTPAPPAAVPKQTAPTEFVAELPADVGSLNLHNTKNNDSSARFQAYQPPGGQVSPTNRFSVPRRAMSSSSLPLADPWRFADPITEQPTREFYILADLLFDALDRKFEPHNTGMLEGPKVLKSWVDLSEEAHKLFSYDNYTALARLWSLAGIPHVMVPVQSSLTPVWNFNQHSHAQDLKVIAEPPSASSKYATYIPALNRAGWYKYFFLEAIHGPEDIYKLLPALCADVYKPGVLNHPDLNKRDRTEMPALQARAAQIQSYAIKRVLDEAKAAIARDAAGPPQMHMAPLASIGAQRSSDEEMEALMSQIQQQANGAAVRAASDDVYTAYKPGQGNAGGYV